MGHDKNKLERSLCDFECTIIQMPRSVKVLLRDKYKLRTLMEKHSLLLHVMLRQGTSWFALDNIDYMIPPPMEESEIWFYISELPANWALFKTLDSWHWHYQQTR